MMARRHAHERAASASSGFHKIQDAQEAHRGSSPSPLLPIRLSDRWPKPDSSRPSLPPLARATCHIALRRAGDWLRDRLRRGRSWWVRRTPQSTNSQLTPRCQTPPHDEGINGLHEGVDERWTLSRRSRGGSLRSSTRRPWRRSGRSWRSPALVRASPGPLRAASPISWPRGPRPSRWSPSPSPTRRGTDQGQGRAGSRGMRSGPPPGRRHVHRHHPRLVPSGTW